MRSTIRVKRHILFITFFACSFLSLYGAGVSQEAQAQTDTTPPALDGTPVISPDIVDLTNGPVEVIVTLQATDAGSGVQTLVGQFIGADGESFAGTFLAILTSGSAQEGTWTGTVEVPANTPAGTYNLNVTLSDVAANAAFIENTAQLTVSGGDTEAPMLVGQPTIEPPVFDLEDGDQVVTIEATLTDNNAGVETVLFSLNNNEGFNVAVGQASLITGNVLNGTWRSEILLTVGLMDLIAPDGNLNLSITAIDTANNLAQFDTGIELEILRARAVVTFQLDTRRLQELGLFTPWQFIEGEGMRLFVDIFDGPDAGVYEMNTFIGDTWTKQLSLIHNQELSYAFAIDPDADGIDSGDWIYELDGSDGGRTLAVGTAPMEVAVATFDNTGSEPVDPAYEARIVRSFKAGASERVAFDELPMESLVQIGFETLDGPLLVAVLRYPADAGGTSPAGISTRAENQYWEIVSIPASATFVADLAIDTTPLSGIVDENALRLLRRTGDNGDWSVVNASIDNGLLQAGNLDAFSTWTLGSTSTANTFLPQLPGVPSNPNPVDGDVRVKTDATLSWDPTPFARSYDLYLWPSASTESEIPTAQDLDVPRFNLASVALDRNTPQSWRVVARNLDGETNGPTWSFTTDILPDLTVRDVQVPADGFSGRPIEVSWIVTNEGNIATDAPVWNDEIQLSSDPFFNNDVRGLGTYINPAALPPGESYAQKKTVTLPDGLAGTHYIRVITNTSGFQEESNRDNNDSLTSIEIELTLPPDLQATQFTTPFNAFSGGVIQVNWTITNAGAGIASTAQGWSDALFLSASPVFDPEQAQFLANRFSNRALDPGASYSDTVEVSLPSGISGTYYLHLIIDQAEALFENDQETNNVALSDPLTITLSPPPDVVVADVSVPPSIEAGATIQVLWTVENLGPGQIDEQSWQDQVYLSSSDQLDLEEAVALARVGRFGSLDPDSLYRAEAAVRIPDGLEGTYFIFVRTDGNMKIFEHTFEDNNDTGFEVQITRPPYPDLSVTGLTTPASTTAGTSIDVRWSVQNQGEALAVPGWTDRLYLSDQATWDTTAVPLLALPVEEILDVNGLYSRTFRVTVPAQNQGPHFLHLVADDEQAVFEYPDDTANNVRTAPLEIAPYPPVDLAVTEFDAPAIGNTGQPIVVNWTVENQGEARPQTTRWEDVLYLSVNQRVDADADIVLLRKSRSAGLAPGASYARSEAIELPDGVDGAFYLLLKTDAAGQIADVDPANNLAVCTEQLDITLSPSADLVPLTVEAPAIGFSGQPVTVSWSVENQGAAAAAGNWSDAVYISKDKTINFEDVRFSRKAPVEMLAVGALYDASLDVTLPIHLSGINYLLIAANQGAGLFEASGTANNVIIREIDIQTPPPGNLIVTNIVVPEMGTPGEELIISWAVQNAGVNAVQGIMYDAVYISADTVWQVADPLLGTDLRVVDLAPGGVLSINKKVDLGRLFTADAEGNITGEFPGLAPGAYHAIVRTDIRNNFREDDETDNAGASTSTIATDIETLALGSTAQATLSAGASRYYRIDVPDDVETFKLSVTTNAANAGNELYVAKGGVPDRNTADFSARDPFVGNQELLVPAQDAGDYFVMLFARQGPDTPQQVAITAEPVSFELTEIDLTRGGAGGYVTVQMKGAAFKNRLKVALEQGEQRFTSTNIHWISQVEAYVTLDLTDVPTGTYDVVLEQNESILQTSPGEELPYRTNDLFLRSVLPDAFSVVSAARTLPEISVVTPEALRAAQDFTVEIDVANEGLNDLVSPLLLVSISSPTIRTGLHVGEGVTEGIKRVVAVGAGPLPGILRPGAQHRVPLFATAPDTSAVLDVHVISPAQNGIPFDFDRELKAAFLDDEVFDEAEAIDQLRVDLARSGWKGYEKRLAETATRLAADGIRELDGSRLLHQLVQETQRSIQTPPFTFIPLEAATGVGKQAHASLPLIDVTKMDAKPDCSPTTLAIQIGMLEAAVALFASPLCEGPTGAKHLQYFIAGVTPGENKTVVYDNDSAIAAKIREFDEAHLSYDEVSGNAIQAADEYIRNQIGDLGCEGPPVTTLPDADFDDLGVMMGRPVLYQKDMISGIPYNDPFNDEEEELGLGKHVPACDLVTAFGGFQDAKARLSNIKVRRIKDPASDACEEPGCKIIYQATISFSFEDNYGFNDNDTGEYDIVAKNVRDCGIAEEFDTRVNMNEDFRRIYDIPPTPKECKKPPLPEIPPGPSIPPISQIPVVQSLDPNDILGPAGYGDEKWVSVSARLPYTIRFENDPKLATAPAQVVTIEQRLDSTLDARSLRLGPFGFGDFSFEPPANSAAYANRLDLVDSLNLFVDVNAGIDIEQNRAFWVIRSIDPTTGGAPSNPLSGFLPVNDSLGTGEGFVSYTVRPDRDALTGDRIDAQAAIIFDTNEAIDTPPIFNTVDAGLPASAVTGLPFKQDSTAFEVSWDANDDQDGSGLRTYTLYASRDGDPFEIYQKGIEGTQVIFNAAKDHTYAFFTIASDQAGNFEPLKTEPDAVVRVSVESAGDLPAIFALEQNYPNPFNPVTTIPFSLSQTGEVELIVYNILGQRVRQYKMGAQPAGWYTQKLDMGPFASGVYFYELRVHAEKTILFRDVKKLVFVK